MKISLTSKQLKSLTIENRVLPKSALKNHLTQLLPVLKAEVQSRREAYERYRTNQNRCDLAADFDSELVSDRLDAESTMLQSTQRLESSVSVILCFKLQSTDMCY